MAEKATAVQQQGRWRAIHVELDIVLTRPEEDAPTIRECRFAVLTLGKPSETGRAAHVIYDRLWNRIVDGVYYGPPEETLYVAQSFNEHPENAYPDNPFMMRAPNGDTLGLLYPGRDDPPADDADDEDNDL